MRSSRRGMALCSAPGEGEAPEVGVLVRRGMRSGLVPLYTAKARATVARPMTSCAVTGVRAATLWALALFTGDCAVDWGIECGGRVPSSLRKKRVLVTGPAQASAPLHAAKCGKNAWPRPPRGGGPARWLRGDRCPRGVEGTRDIVSHTVQCLCCEPVPAEELVV